MDTIEEDPYSFVGQHELPTYTKLSIGLQRCGFPRPDSDFSAETMIHENQRQSLNAISCHLLMCSYFVGFKADWETVKVTLTFDSPMHDNSVVANLAAVEGNLAIQVSTLKLKYMAWLPSHIFPEVFAPQSQAIRESGMVNMPEGSRASSSGDFSALLKRALGTHGATLVMTHSGDLSSVAVWAIYRDLDKIHVLFPEGVMASGHANILLNNISFQKSFMEMIHDSYPTHAQYFSVSLPLASSPGQKKAMLPTAPIFRGLKKS